MLNAKKAAETITANGLGTIISEETLQQGQTFTMTVNSNGTEPLEATIAWTDVPGNVNNGILNSTTPVLVNDLDIRITKGTSTYFPWRLTSDPNSDAANDGDNKVDNIEKISIPATAGTYTITVTHKGTLVQGPQNFSLIVTGVNSTFSLTPLSEDQTVCSNSNAVYNFQHTTTTSENTNFTILGLPAGATGNLSASSSSINEALTMTISNLNTLPAGNYTIGIRGTREQM
ncbi:hypothetical protein H9W95_03615 [Flavobacterium lindanitolerans]|nr:hypothetical protein [Flavobacterium lindanitolerans]